jgi:hypothetical protein
MLERVQNAILGNYCESERVLGELNLRGPRSMAD